MSIDTSTVIGEVLVRITGRPCGACAEPDALLERDLGVDSLTLLELVETLQDRLSITVPDEVTARVRTVADLRDAVRVLTVAAPSPHDDLKGSHP
ncbi:phosphopantetheine-binding protein [Streptomyces sp. NPDC056835]|uniref:phosphopantetheine-binding protein n=1 Tax=Streptomyces sp. NPDC056835 TaxID=3345956 RepID=UPI0036BD1261